MKRLWLGIGILAVLLGLVIGVQAAMCRIHLPIQKKLSQAQEAALAGDWESAHRLAAEAQSRWENYHELTAAVADHSPMDELDMLFGELTVFSQQEETLHFAATCATAAQIAQAMADAHVFSWWNFF